MDIMTLMHWWGSRIRPHASVMVPQPRITDIDLAEELDRREVEALRRLDYLEAQAELLDGGKRSRISRGPQR